MTDPTGAPSSAKPNVASVNRRCLMTWGMCAVHEANNSPFATNTAVTASRGRRSLVAGPGCRLVTVGLDTPDLDTGRLKLRQQLARRGPVGHENVELRQLADEREGQSSELGAVCDQDPPSGRRKECLLYGGVAEVIRQDVPINQDAAAAQHHCVKPDRSDAGEGEGTNHGELAR